MLGAARMTFERRPRWIEPVDRLALAPERAPGRAEVRARSLEVGDGITPAANRRLVHAGQRQAGRQFHAGVVAALLGRRGHGIVEADAVTRAVHQSVLREPGCDGTAPEPAERFARRT